MTLTKTETEVLTHIVFWYQHEGRAHPCAKWPKTVEKLKRKGLLSTVKNGQGEWAKPTAAALEIAQ